jgi:hydroxymethylpyrimidine/phosphomethylpyrimidine kinase
MADQERTAAPATSRGRSQTTETGGAPFVALTVAGFDPSSGAGITADLKTFSAHGVYGVACISALTVQSTQGVRSVEAVRPEVVRDTLDCLADDTRLAGVKIGMLGTAGVVAEVASFLKQPGVLTCGRDRVVLDPVLRSTSGASLLDTAGVQLLVDELLISVGWITPNLAELAVLTGSGPIVQNEIPAAARGLKELAVRRGNRELNVLVTGGHLDKPDDFLLLANGEDLWLPGERVETTSTHGTGCAFSSALLCGLIAGKPPVDAAKSAKAFVAGALRSAQPVGRGRGPLNHFFRLSSTS